MGREYFLQPICWPLCCGGLPIYGLLKSLICMIPCCLFFTLAITFSSIFLLPLDLFCTYRAIAQTKKWGWNVKILSFILLPFLLLLWPLVVLMGAFLFSLGYSLGAPVYYTLNSKYNFWYGGIPEVYSNCFCRFVKNFWNFNYYQYFEYIERFRTYQLKAAEEPFDIPIHWIPIGLFYSILGVLVALPSAIIIAVIKYIPAIVRVYIEWWRWYISGDCFFTVIFTFIFLVGLLVIPVGLIGVAILGIIFSIGLGISVAIVAYRQGHIVGLKRVITNIYDMDNFTNECIFKQKSCLSCMELNPV